MNTAWYKTQSGKYGVRQYFPPLTLALEICTPQQYIITLILTSPIGGRGPIISSSSSSSILSHSLATLKQ